MSGVPSAFLAHSSRDKDLVRKLGTDLQIRNVKVWLDEWEIRVGDSLHSKISQGIRESGHLIVVLSQHSVVSPWVAQELNAALAVELERSRVFVLPARIDDCELPIFLKDKRYADFRFDYNTGLQDLLRTIIPDYPLPSPRDGIVQLETFLLPAFSHKEVVAEHHMTRIQEALHALESQYGISPTQFRSFRNGQIVTAGHINELVYSIDQVRAAAGLNAEWKYHPVSVGKMYSSDHLNELFGKINEVIRKHGRVQSM